MLSKKKWLIALLFLFISPWFVQLLSSGIEWWWIKSLNLNLNRIWENFITNTSVDFLFFEGDSRVKFGTQETGPFYIYQVPLILIGFYCLAAEFNRTSQILIAWLVAGLVFASLFVSPDFSNDIFYFLALQIISFLGLVKLADLWQTKKLIYRILITLFALLAVYEMTIYFHIMLVHYPKRLEIL